MKFGKRREDIQVPGVPGVAIPVKGSRKRGKRDARDAAASAAAVAAASAAAPVTDSWTPHAESAAPPVAREEPVALAQPLGYTDPVVEGEAVELPSVEPAAPIYEPLVPLTLQGTGAMPDPLLAPVAEQPVSAVESAGPIAGGAAVTSLSDSGEAFASGHAAAPGPSWQEPLMALADDRPELVVGAAFAGGILAAMILRRLGN